MFEFHLLKGFREFYRTFIFHVLSSSPDTQAQAQVHHLVVRVSVYLSPVSSLVLPAMTNNINYLFVFRGIHIRVFICS